MHRRRALTLFAGLALCPLCASIGLAAEESKHWTYEGDTGPNTWGSLDAADAPCSAGNQQSPVDIIGAISARQPPLKIDWSGRADTIINNGHTIQLNFAGGGALHLGDHSYGLQQFHFHHPSEHPVDGKGFAMEAHFVHLAESGGLAVLGVFIVPGKSNAVLNKIVSIMPSEQGQAVAADPAIDPGRLLPKRQTFYHYAGSLTTPPCSQTVDWLVLARPIEAAATDIARFAKLYPMNARPVQKLDRRFILTSGLH